MSSGESVPRSRRLPARTAAAPLVLLLASSAAAQSLQFAVSSARPPVPFLPPFGNLTSLSTADVNGDGQLDLVSLNTTSGAAFFGPAFAQSTAFGTGSAQHRPRFVDLDGNGVTDVALVPDRPGSRAVLRLLLQQPTGWTAVQLPATLQTATLAGADLGDIDGDGDIDVVVSPVPANGAPLVVLRNGGILDFTVDPTPFQASLPAGILPRLIDLDGDGDLDVLGCVPGGGFVLLRNVGATFSNYSGALPATRVDYRDFLLHDLDGDGGADVVALHADGGVDAIWCQPGAVGALPTFRFQQDLQGPRALATANRIGVADTDGDGFRGDVVCATDAGLDVLLGNGNHTFARTQVVDEGVAVFAAIDTDADGRDDLVFTAMNSPALSRRRLHFDPRIEDTALLPSIDPASVAQTRTMAFGDLDGDGRTDILRVLSNQIVTQFANGDGTYSLPNATALTGMGSPVQLADLDGDGDLDLVAQTERSVAVARNDGGTFTTPVSVVPIGQDLVYEVRAADVDGDGDLDLLISRAVGVNFEIELARNLGQFTLSTPVAAIPPATNAFARFEAADLDGDGDLDLMTTLGAPFAPNQCFENDGTGTFTLRPSFSVQMANGPNFVARYQEMVCVDLDGDGDLDLVAVGDNGTETHRNNGHGVFSLGTFLPTAIGNPCLALAALDADDDGDLDFVRLDFTPGTLARQPHLLQNDGLGNLIDVSPARVPALNLDTASRFAVGDFDDDGDDDVAVSGSQTKLLLNRQRLLESPQSPHLGGLAEFTVHSGPGPASSGTAVLAFATGLLPSPIQVPGFRGVLQLDPASLQPFGSALMTSIGPSSVFFGVPPTPALVSLRFFVQGAVLPNNGALGFTNAVTEILQP